MIQYRWPQIFHQVPDNLGDLFHQPRGVGNSGEQPVHRLFRRRELYGLKGEAQGGQILAHLVVQFPGQVLPPRFFHLRQPGRQGPELATLAADLLLGPLPGGVVLLQGLIQPCQGGGAFLDALVQSVVNLFQTGGHLVK